MKFIFSAVVAGLPLLTHGFQQPAVRYSGVVRFRSFLICDVAMLRCQRDSSWRI